MRRRWKILLWTGGALLALSLGAVIAALLILPSAWFREKVRARIVSEVERASGGRVEVSSFQFDWTTMTAEVAPFVLHGTEPAGEPPLFRAERVAVGLRIISVFRRDIDIASVQVDQPRVNIQIGPDGVTNFPHPKIRRTDARDPIEQLVALKIGEIRLRNGELRYGDRRLPLDLHGRYLNAKVAYNFDGPSYQGDLSMKELTADAPGILLPTTFAFDSRVTLSSNRVSVQQARLTMRDTTIEVSGTVDDFKAPRMAFQINGTGALADIGKPLRIPIEHTGQALFNGRLEWDRPGGLRITGRLTGQHLAYRAGPVNLRQVSLASDVNLVGSMLQLRGVTVHALDGVFNGQVDVRGAQSVQVNGKLTGVSIQSLAMMTGYDKFGLAGTLNGPVEVRGSPTNLRALRAAGRFDVVASQGGVPVRGFVQAAWDGRKRTLELGQSNLSLPSTAARFSGTFGEKLAVHLESSDLEDLRPLLGEEKLPLELAGGAAVFDGTVTGPLDKARVQGSLALPAFKVQDQTLDRLTATIDATASGVSMTSLALAQQALRLTGSLNVALDNWRPSEASALSGSVRIAGAPVARVLASLGQKLPVDGIASGTAEFFGRVGDPAASADLTVDQVEVYGERFDSVRARLRYTSQQVDILDAVARAGQSSILFGGVWRHPRNEWRNGSLDVHVTTGNWALSQVENLRQRLPEFTGKFSVKGKGTFAIQNGQPLPQSLDGSLALSEIARSGRNIGQLTVDFRTANRQLNLVAGGSVRGRKVTGDGSFQMAGDYPGSGSLAFAQLPLGALQDIVLTNREALPVAGFVAGRVTFSGPARFPAKMRAKLELPTLEVSPARRTMNERQRTELTLRNDGPIEAEYDGKAVVIRAAHMLGRETDLRLSGSIMPDAKTAFDLRVQGNLNLGVLQDFDESVVSSGIATLNGSVKGSLDNPQLAGRMEVKNASFYLADFPNGLDNITGTILFDRQRANIERLRANTGGGDLALTGFVGFASRELIYQLQGRAERVRIRYPEGVSTTANAALTLTGTTSRSLLTGVVTVVRAGFNPKTDIASMLASAPVPTASPASQNTFLRGMQFDVRLETVPNLQLQTALTSDLQAEADLRLRGSAAKPVLLGRVVVSQGDIQFFGTKYTINRGEIGFFNPVRIEPVVDLSLETRVRGVVVNINFAGQLNKLNVSYRSDPPLQSTEIVALLAVGRAPGTNSSLASSQTVNNQGILGGSGNSLLGQAVTAPLSSRLQRFFGVSRLKIDPQLTGLSAVPQARLTIEQQISRDITLTYVTNLAQANQQIIRLQWDVDRNWSVVAVREENGVFGVDFFFKKRFR